MIERKLAKIIPLHGTLFTHLPITNRRELNRERRGNHHIAGFLAEFVSYARVTFGIPPQEALKLAEQSTITDPDATALALDQTRAYLETGDQRHRQQVITAIHDICGYPPPRFSDSP